MELGAGGEENAERLGKRGGDDVLEGDETRSSGDDTGRTKLRPETTYQDNYMNRFCRRWIGGGLPTPRPPSSDCYFSHLYGSLGLDVMRPPRGFLAWRRGLGFSFLSAEELGGEGCVCRLRQATLLWMALCDRSTHIYVFDAELVNVVWTGELRWAMALMGSWC